ncbi:MAG TPA: YihY/virulence factor BrkB family protein [Flavipsychrobacter sp.]|nr:YihY/virulence factor BrkB family protein [Flavipsychrobacter sp.]
MTKGLLNYFRLLKEAASEFSTDNVIKLSASLAYYTVFSIGPLLLVIISFTGLFFEQEKITGSIYQQMNNFIGPQGADQVLSIIRQMQQQNAAAKFSIIGIVLLIFGATGVFVDIQDSINYIWSIRAKPKKGWLKFLKNRMLSFSLIVGVGFLLIASLLINTITDLLTDRLQQIFVDEAVIFFKILNIVILFLITSILFTVIYKVLPDAYIHWKDALFGATFTALLFLAGRFLIGIYLSKSEIANTYGAAASIIIILSWVYYSSIILYFGAEFTKVYALSKGRAIRPNDTAVYIIKREAKELP